MDADLALAELYQDEAHAVARGLGMTECAARLPAADEEEVSAAIEEVLADEDASSIEIDEIEGHDAFAEAEVVPTGGRYDLEAVKVELAASDGGEWELVEINPFGSDSG